MHSKLFTIALVAGLGSACLPSNLDKYRKKSGSDGAQGGVEDPMLPRSKDAENVSDKRRKPLAPPSDPRARATIYAVDKHTYRFSLREPDVWDTVINVLLRNYNLTIVDRSSGVITTEWDSFFLDKEVYRNRLSLRVVKTGRDQVEMTVHNNVERLRDASQATNTVGAVWLPAEDRGSEVARIVQNMALLLNQPPPVLPPDSAIAKGSSAPAEEPL
jgi:hypothetical protein